MDTKALRQKILDLAIRGKLVPQDPNDEPASVLLERIREQKKQMVKEGILKAKDIKNDSVIFVGEDNLHYEKFTDGSVKCIEDEIPFELPDGWAWARLKHICMMAAGKAKSSDQIKSEPFDGCYPCFGGNGIRGYIDEYSQEGTFSIVGRQGALCGNINIASGKFYATEHAVVTTLFEGIDFNWSNYTLEALRLNKYATGAAQPGLSVANVLNVFVPVPPTQEQIYIGHQISRFIKIIENITNEKEDLQTLIYAAKSKILDLAIRGQLVPQDPTDEPASVLLERIRAEKEELIKQGKIKRDKKESIIFKGEDNSYYDDIPDGWTVCYLRELFNVCSAKRVKQSDWCTEGVPFYRAREIVKLSDNDFVDNELYISEDHYQQVKKEYGIPQPGDLMVSGVGTIGKVYVVKDTDRFYYKDASVLCFENRNRIIDSQYARYMLMSEFIQNQMKENSKGTTVDTITISAAMNYICLVPPINEQKRIVSAIEQILNYLKIIESALL